MQRWQKVEKHVKSWRHSLARGELSRYKLEMLPLAEGGFRRRRLRSLRRWFAGHRQAL